LAPLTMELDDALAEQLDASRQATGGSAQDIVRDGLAGLLNATALNGWSPSAEDHKAVGDGRADFAAVRSVAQEDLDAEMTALISGA
jgi:hypothetical protein